MRLHYGDNMELNPSNWTPKSINPRWDRPGQYACTPSLQLYLEEALKNKEDIWKYFNLGKTFAYADDVVIRIRRAAEMTAVMLELRKIEQEQGIKINK